MVERRTNIFTIDELEEMGIEKWRKLPWREHGMAAMQCI
jgi:hypothetical protein